MISNRKRAIVSRHVDFEVEKYETKVKYPAIE